MYPKLTIKYLQPLCFKLSVADIYIIIKLMLTCLYYAKSVLII
jgi:hypothetical protein